MFASETIYNDTDVAQIESLPPTALHRNVDLAIVAADEAGYARTHIILPPTIYGLANGKLVDIGAQNRHSIQIPGFIKYTIARGEVGIVGEGKNIWPNVALGEGGFFCYAANCGALTRPAIHSRRLIHYSFRFHLLQPRDHRSRARRILLCRERRVYTLRSCQGDSSSIGRQRHRKIGRADAFHRAGLQADALGEFEAGSIYHDAVHSAN